MSDLHRPVHPVRLVTASALFDGHDASINIMRRILQSQGAEVIHLGHNRSVREVVDAALEEDAHGVAVSSYQGGHVEYFEYLVESLRRHGAEHVRVVGGGGGVIVPEEIARLRDSGVTIFSPEDGQRMGLAGMVNSVIRDCDFDLWDSGAADAADAADVLAGDRFAIARALTGAELGKLPPDLLAQLRGAAAARTVPVLGITGTGGSGKSSLTDELVRRFRLDQQDKLRIAVIAVDPTRRRGGGALLGDRIRMNSLDGNRVFFRSLATRGSRELPEHLTDVIDVVKAAGFDLVIVETPGIGQGDAAIVPFVDTSLYVMTPEFGAASQLEKIDMLDFADVVAINKFERRGAKDALRDVGRQLVRNREAFGMRPEDMPVYGTSAATFNDDGVTALHQHLKAALAEKGLPLSEGATAPVDVRHSSGIRQVVPAGRVRYLAEVTDTVRAYHAETERLAEAARRAQRLDLVSAELVEAGSDAGNVRSLLDDARRQLPHEVVERIANWPAVVASYSGDEQVVKVRDKEIRTRLTRESLSGNKVRRVALPRFTDHGELVNFWRRENLPGHFPFTAGVFPFKRDGEDPARMFAGEGDPFRTNRRFKLLSEGQPATRLSTAFDSVTLYGRDPDERPDVYGKVGTSGVSVATLEDMKALYDGFDLVAPTTSVSMTINGPAPTVLAFFLNTVVDQRIDHFRAAEGRDPSPEETAELRAHALANVRGTVQADILKEDQGQNTCLFSTEFSLRMMADIQEWFIEQKVRNFYSVSISGYHIAEAGANPVSQLAFTLANGFTYVEAYLARGMHIDDFAPNLSFFFSNGMDPEYTVLGRVARRIWAVAMKEKYGANERSQKLKYHVQTSGRSLHAQEMDFNDIRTTLQALIAIYDNCNSLHTNAYDEAVTTPTEESVRRALAIQLIINREWGLAMNENPLQGSFVIDELTDLVEEAVLQEFERISERGGVLGAMETGYQRGRIQDESMLYEQRKHDGSLPLIGVNTFRNPHADTTEPGTIELARATEQEKQSQLARVRDHQARHRDQAHAALTALKDAAVSGRNVFAVLMDAARVCSLQQITEAFFEVGGQYRRNV
ncbi:methylmalonyl-CoA mutase family protein [Streptomyces caniscabiei]|uniref:Fused isobutyryl-CoA mutase n=1 Tax=Streptomyces caniscabiei TaxID=2746961 RepID=A0A927L3I6_9ACTN|nr:fused isobutyryl-CoA mutase/GTPase IcmF [Streptomyces caniscabiei]MBD9724266.1 cobalamin B12-binding domain-containing protein [Streptomyces caniscabiei]MDX3513254.1 methylmalonyl-CoA mutase family protein [Streptomyces caniscabiei]MDX3718755.1 methylmalonyl-CoA mutase family protein [Streptomyces caniscabiei]WEO21856.1 methylmalonyl-CoA mutase family protein [Streptomyces caniscabiei]